MPHTPAATDNGYESANDHNALDTATSTSSSPKRKGESQSAFAELMKLKPKPPTDDRHSKRPKTATSSTGNSYFGRDGLLAYIAEPESFPKSRVIRFNSDWVLIHDLYPKASVHLLLLPRDPEVYSLHPLYAFKDVPGFLDRAREEVEVAKAIAAEELRRLHGSTSTKERQRREAMEADDPPSPSSLPQGRDWSRALKVGVHANPSMNHLHIHVLSEDMHSPCLKHRQHYQSFNTEFLVPIDAMPLSNSQIEAVRTGAHEALKERGSRCWRCERDFGNKWVKLKEHLDEEFEAWRKE